MTQVRDYVLRIRCRRETASMLKAYRDFMGLKSLEDALIDLMKKTGWLEKYCSLKRGTLI